MSPVDQQTPRPRSQIIDGSGMAVAGALVLLGAAITDWFPQLVGSGLLMLAIVDVRRLGRTRPPVAAWARSPTRRPASHCS